VASFSTTYLQGSYGTVRACTHVPSGKQYAVKILSKRKGNEERSEIIMREVRSSRSWSTPVKVCWDVLQSIWHDLMRGRQLCACKSYVASIESSPEVSLQDKPAAQQAGTCAWNQASASQLLCPASNGSILHNAHNVQ
jgi:serine/threonine protein kinase